MKPQIILPIGLLVLAIMFYPGNASGAGNNLKKEISKSKKHILAETMPEHTTDDPAAQPAKPVRPSKPQSKEPEKDSIPHREPSSKKAHSDEDGKHHHFHMHRAKKAKRYAALFCTLAKILLLILHISLLMYVLNAPFAH